MFGFGRFLNPRDVGAIARALHSRWLTRAVEGRREYPRIPLRRADQGGFDRMMSTPEGRERAERWWNIALERVDD
jgi:hypothetical protein